MPAFLPAAGLALGGLGGIAGSLFGGRKQPSFEDLERMFGEGALAKRAQGIFGLLANSPSFRMALGNTNIAGQQLGQKINTNLARSGLLNSGIGAVGSAAGESAGGFGVQQLVGGLHSSALDQAGQLNQLLAQLFGQMQQQPTGLQTGSGALLGALSPLIADYFKRRPAGGQ